MAVELHCPDCRAKLRLPAAPDPGEDVECPKCGHVFPAPDLDDAAEDRPKKKPAAEKKPEKKGEKKSPARRLKAKKKKSNPAILAGIVVGGLVFIGLVTALLVWFTRRQPAAVEMMYYLPEDTELATGFNIGHTQKYDALFKSVETAFADAPFRKAFDAVGKAVGQEPKDLMDYAVTGIGRTPNSAAIVLRTKKEFDVGKLAKLPGAREASENGVKYYKVDRIDGVAFTSPRVFAPTNRLVVICPGDIPADKFRGMLQGNKEKPEAAITGRMGALGNRVTRGTFWVLYTFGTGSKNRPAKPPAQAEDGGFGGNADELAWLQMINKLAGSAKGMGYKVSVGSRDIRFEWDVWYDDPEKAAAVAKEWKESEIAKGDEGDIRTVRWWPYLANKFGDKKVQTELLNHLAFTSSGEVFAARSDVATALMMMQMSNLANRALDLMPGVNPAKKQQGGG